MPRRGLFHAERQLDLGPVAAISVCRADFRHFVEQPAFQVIGSGHHEPVVGDVQVVLVGFLARICDMVDCRASQFPAIISARSRTLGFGHLVEENVDPPPVCGGLSIASWMQRTVSWMLMKARVCPPVPLRGSAETRRRPA
ncbi:MAG: hypothetical protein R3D43_12825 [Tepidamorphaceae bacterium]